jgi:hypothetical protein
MRDDDDDLDIPPPTAELDVPEERAAVLVLEPVRAARPVGSVGTHLLAAAAGALLGALALVAAAALYGAYEEREFEALKREIELSTPPAPAPAPAPAPRGLRAIDGKAVAFVPTGRVQLVNVWLEGCSDCMPSFEAWKKHVADERLPSGLPISNVAYMRASEDYVRRYRVAEGLVIDDGTNVVRPLGISRFTTLVVAADGTVCHRDDPAAVGYVERLRAAVERCGSRP